MKLREYLNIRNQSGVGLTQAEGKTMGVDPTKKGWMQFLDKAEAPALLVDAVLRGATTNELREIARGLNRVTRVEMLGSTPNPPRPGSLAPLKRIQAHHLAAATKYLQERGRLLSLGDSVAPFPVVARELGDLYKTSPGFAERYGKGQDGLRRMVIEFFDDAPALKNEHSFGKHCSANDGRRKQTQDAVKRSKPNSQVAAEIKAHRAKTQRQPAPVYRVPSGSLKVEGVDVSSKDFLSTYAWRNLRIKALNLYGRKCMCCGDTPENGAVMNVDHIKPRKHHPELALDIRWLQILCGACNHGKGNELETDYRSPEQVAAAKSAALVM